MNLDRLQRLEKIVSDIEKNQAPKQREISKELDKWIDRAGIMKMSDPDQSEIEQDIKENQKVRFQTISFTIKKRIFVESEQEINDKIDCLFYDQTKEERDSLKKRMISDFYNLQPR